jgi:hypothetical protein
MLHAVVKNGRLVLDEPSDLPDGTVVKLGVSSPSEIAPDALGFIDEALKPAIHAFYRLWEAVTNGRQEQIPLLRAQLLATLERGESARVGSLDVLRDATRQLSQVPAIEIRPQDLTRLELAVFGARLPQRAEDEYEDRARGAAKGASDV